jgi:predicted transcriptional regulator
MKKLSGKTWESADRDESAQVIAGMFGVTSDYVRKIVRGERNNLLILRTYQLYQHGKKRLLSEVKKSIKK